MSETQNCAYSRCKRRFVTTDPNDKFCSPKCEENHYEAKLDKAMDTTDNLSYRKEGRKNG